MIRLLTEDRVADFTYFCKKRLTGAVIYTRFLTYGLYSGEVFFWYSEDENGTLNGVFSMVDGILLSCADEVQDDEITLFAQTVGAISVTYGQALYTLKYTGNENSYTAYDLSGENIKNAFDVIFEEDGNRKSYFERWYTDASHKIRHGLIHGKCIYEDGKCVAVALTSGETDSIAVISSVATLKNYRKKGYGEKAVLSLAQSVSKDIYLMTDNEKIKCWYEKIGFTAI